MAKERALRRRRGDKFFPWTICGGTALVMFFIFANWVEAQETTNPTCPIKKLNGIEAQEMMVKGVFMNTELEKQTSETNIKYTFVHTVRADWNIWICIQQVDVKNRQPENITLSCTTCDY